MAKKTDNRTSIILKCVECADQSYHTKKNRKNTTEKLELNKYCPKCRKSTIHKEVK